MVFRSVVCVVVLAFTVSNVSADEKPILGVPDVTIPDQATKVLPQGGSKRDQNAVLTRSKLTGTNNVHVAGNVILAGQPSEAALAELSKRGFKTIVSLRGVGEERYDEAAVCEKLGMKFVRLPIQNPNDVSPKLLRDVARILALAKPGAGVMLHCASANRVGAVWLAFRVKQGRMPIQQARKEAAEVGLKTPQLEQKALEFLGQ